MPPSPAPAPGEGTFEVQRILIGRELGLGA
jgi:hypothetical protein